MSQPKNSPRWATDTLYSTGPDLGLANKVAPSTGVAAQGFVRDTKMPAPRLNYQLALLGDHLDAIIDSAVLNWTTPLTTAGTDTENKTNPTTGVLYTVPATGNRIESVIQFNPARCLRFDGGQWTEGALYGHGGAATGGYAIGALASDVHIVAWDADGAGTKNVRRSLDHGDFWGAAGTILNGDGALVGGYLPGVERFFIFGRGQIFYSDTLANSAWTVLSHSGSTGWTGAPPTAPKCCAHSSDEIALGLGGGPGVLHSLDGAAWTATALPSPDAVATVVSIHWNEVHLRWFALTSTGKLYSAPSGIPSWTLIHDSGGSTASVTSLGRTIIVSSYAGAFISRDLQNWRFVPVPSKANYAQWEWATAYQGRVMLGRPITESGDLNLAYSESGRLPGVFTDAGGAW
jgi:hypothetical protein